MTIKRVAIYSLSVPLCIAIYQGHKMRTKWLETGKLDPPTGQLTGIENWKSKIKIIQDRFHDATQISTSKNNTNTNDNKTNTANPTTANTEEDNRQIITNIENIFASIRQKIMRNNENEKDQIILVNKIKIWMENMYSILDQQMHIQQSSSSASKSSMYESSSSVSSSSSSQQQRPRKIKLLIIGDSLAAGVGCHEREQTPVLVKTLSTILSITLGVDIEWKVAGIVGGTVNQLRTQLLPTIKSDFLTISSKEMEQNDIQIIAVIICGLNDWRTMLEKFPFGSGPETFKKDLLHLITDLKSDLPSKIKCRIFLPSTPLSIALTDPTSLFTQQPVASLIGFLNNQWDNQKHHLACDCQFSTSATATDSSSSSSWDPLSLPPISCIRMDNNRYTNDFDDDDDDFMRSSRNRIRHKLITTNKSSSTSSSSEKTNHRNDISIHQFNNINNNNNNNTNSTANTTNTIAVNTTNNDDKNNDDKNNDDNNNDDNNNDNSNNSSNSSNSCTTRYIDSPDVSSLYATPGIGTISIDGVHPSNQGYKWWALHIAEAILASELE